MRHNEAAFPADAGLGSSLYVREGLFEFELLLEPDAAPDASQGFSPEQIADWRGRKYELLVLVVNVFAQSLSVAPRAVARGGIVFVPGNEESLERLNALVPGALAEARDAAVANLRALCSAAQDEGLL